MQSIYHSTANFLENTNIRSFKVIFVENMTFEVTWGQKRVIFCGKFAIYAIYISFDCKFCEEQESEVI